MSPQTRTARQERRPSLRDPESLRLRGTLALVGLGASALFAVASLVVGLQLHGAARAGSDAGVTAALDRLWLVELAQGVVRLFTVVAFLVWWHAAILNLPRAGLSGVRVRPVMGVVGWFIPFVNLVQPMLSAAEIWRGSRALHDGATGRGWRTRGGAGPVYVWWSVWVAYLLLESFARLRLRVIVHDPVALARDYETPAYWTSVAAGCEVVAALLACRVVHRITAWQDSAVDALDDEDDLGPGWEPS